MIVLRSFPLEIRSDRGEFVSNRMGIALRNHVVTSTISSRSVTMFQMGDSPNGELLWLGHWSMLASLEQDSGRDSFESDAEELGATVQFGVMMGEGNGVETSSRSCSSTSADRTTVGASGFLRGSGPVHSAWVVLCV